MVVRALAAPVIILYSLAAGNVAIVLMDASTKE